VVRGRNNTAVNLEQALDIVGAPLRVSGFSDDSLASTVNSKLSAGDVELSAVPMLHGVQQIRPADVLRWLASATRPRYHVDVYDVHAHWGLLRYLGLFDADASGSLMLSAAGQRIRGNQRRVTSEELGIGFAAHLAETWATVGRAGRSTIRVVDIDVALDHGFVSAGGHRITLDQTGTHRPDYLLISESTDRPGRFTVALLECKGTKIRQHAYRQLAHAAAQLGSVNVGRQRPAGLVVSTVIAQESVAYYALQHHPDRPWRFTTSGAAASAANMSDDITVAAVAEVDLSEVDLEELPEASPDQSASADLRLLTATALEGSWAALADLAGNDQAFQRWAPERMRARLGRTYADRPQRARYTGDDIDIVGVRNIVSLPGGQLEVILGVEAGVDQSLTTGTARAVLAAQQRVAREGWRFQQAERRGASVISLADDGSALVLNPL
jgi:hypothetical protein